MLVGKYIPNLVTKKFDVSRECAQLIYDQTSSPFRQGSEKMGPRQLDVP
jgi:hypothetical protein